jgi:hypothetical protein
VPFISCVLKTINAIGSLPYVAVVTTIGAISLGGIAVGISQGRGSYVLMGVGLSFMLVDYYYRWHPNPAKHGVQLRFRFILGATGFALLSLGALVEK